MVTKQLFSLSALSLFSFASLLHADYINGTVWSVPASTAGSTPVAGSAPGAGATELATFSANGIDFSGDGPGAYNIGGFLASNGVASNITYMNGATAASDLNNTLWEFTGSATFTNGETFNVVHDDGVNMYVNGTAVLLDPGPTAPVTSTFTYTGATGTFNFDFIYTECCGGTADFSTTIVPNAPSAPEPPSGLLYAAAGLALSGLRWLGRRK